MTWVRIDDTFPELDAVQAAGLDGLGLLVAAVAHSNRTLADGWISTASLQKLAGKRSRTRIERLVNLQLLTPCSRRGIDGFTLPADLVGLQPTSAQVLERRATKARRQARWRASRDAARVASTTPSTRGAVDGGVDPAPSRPVPVQQVHTPRAREASGGNGRGPGAGAGTFPRDHLRHVVCGRRCVPEFLHGEFLAGLGGDEGEADQQLRAWYRETLAAIPEEQPIGDEPARFWRAQFARWQPSAVPAPDARARAAPARLTRADAPDDTEALRALQSRQAAREAREDAAEALAARYVERLGAEDLAALTAEAQAALEHDAPHARARMTSGTWLDTLARKRRALVVERFTPAQLERAIGQQSGEVVTP